MLHDKAEFLVQPRSPAYLNMHNFYILLIVLHRGNIQHLAVIDMPRKRPVDCFMSNLRQMKLQMKLL